MLDYKQAVFDCCLLEEHLVHKGSGLGPAEDCCHQQGKLEQLESLDVNY